MNRKKKFEDKYISIKGYICNNSSGEITKSELDLSTGNDSLINSHYVLCIYETDDNFDEKKLIGEINLTYLDIEMGKYKEGFSAFDVFDLSNEDIHLAYPVFFDEDGDLKEEFESWHNDFIYISEIFIKKEYRNRGIGSKLINKLPDIIRNQLKLKVGCIFLYAKPSEKDKDGNLNRINDKQKQEELIKFYERCGFIRIGDTPYLYHNTDYEIK